MDTKEWWIPRIPLFGKDDFETAPVPSDLPAEFTPPDGLLRFENISMFSIPDPFTGMKIWLPNYDLNAVVDDYHENVDLSIKVKP